LGSEVSFTDTARIDAVITFRSINCKSELKKNKNWIQWTVFATQGSPVEIQTSAHWSVICRSMTALPPVLSPCSILPSPFSHCASIPARYNSSSFVKMLLIHWFCFFKLALSLRFRKLKSRVCSCWFAYRRCVNWYM